MTLFGDLMRSQGTPTLMKYLGESSSGDYVKPDGEVVPCQGILTNTGKTVEVEETGERLRIEREWILTTDPDHAEWPGIADPETKATAVINGVTYSVGDVHSISENLVSLGLVRMPIKRRSRDQFRRP